MGVHLHNDAPRLPADPAGRPAAYLPTHDVTLGWQTSHERTHVRVNRWQTVAQFQDAAARHAAGARFAALAVSRRLMRVEV